MRLIDADVAIEELTDRSHEAAKRVGTDSPFWEGLVIARRIVNNLPTIQPEPHEGEWEQVSAQRYFMSASYFYRCSACGVNNVRNTNYCPNCGAKMKEIKENEQ